MTTQPEQILENELVDQLTGLEYTYVHINNEDGILSNLKIQLETFNNTTFSDKEFSAILKHLAKGNVFEKAKPLRQACLTALVFKPLSLWTPGVWMVQ